MEEETVKRIEEMVALRVAEELEKRKDEIEAEVLRRVEEAKQIMEQQMLEELERRRKERLEEEKRREVGHFILDPAVALPYALLLDDGFAVRPFSRRLFRSLDAVRTVNSIAFEEILLILFFFLVVLWFRVDLEGVGR